MLGHPKLEIAAISNDVWNVYSLYGPSIYCYGMLRLNQSLSEGKGCFCLDNNQQMPQQPAAALSSSESDNIYLWTGCWSDDYIKKEQDIIHFCRKALPG